jgi:Putative F0F1-ATPase subunit Ca2+/Mg2+ transporter
VKLVPRTKPIDADDNIGRGMDFALVILVFLGIGWGIDRALDTRPVFMIGCTVFSVVGQFIRMWYAYDAKMSQLETERSTEVRSAPRASVVVEDLAYAPLEIPSEIIRETAANRSSGDGVQGVTA